MPRKKVWKNQDKNRMERKGKGEGFVRAGRAQYANFPPEGPGIRNKENGEESAKCAQVGGRQRRGAGRFMKRNKGGGGLDSRKKKGLSHSRRTWGTEDTLKRCRKVPECKIEDKTQEKNRTSRGKKRKGSTTGFTHIGPADTRPMEDREGGKGNRGQGKKTN